MTFQSILFDDTKSAPRTESAVVPEFFVDLNLDQIVQGITAGRNEYELEPFFHCSMKDINEIEYRHEVMRELENKDLLAHVESFAQAMRLMRQKIAQSAKLYYKQQKQWWFLDAVDIYCRAVKSFLDDLAGVELRSRGFSRFRAYLAAYVASDHFTSLVSDVQQIKCDLSQIRYCFVVRGNSVTVRQYESEQNYGIEVERTFEKFAQREAKDYRVKFHESPEMDHVEAHILEFVARLNEELFDRIDAFCDTHREYHDPTLKRFDREIQFYVSYGEFIGNLKRAGLPFCYPQLSRKSKEISSRDGFDLALARKLIAERSPVVCNDFHLEGPERVFIVSGPNQGGKTTFARTFGQLHYLASLGCPVPGREARLFLFDKLFTHFEREERVTDLRSKLEHDLIRLRDILRSATADSIIVMNETFGSTTLKDAVFLGREIMARILDLDALGVFVTFVDELASLSGKTVSMVSTIVPEHPAMRTFKVIRRPSDGRAYAISIAEKYRLTYDALRERLPS